MAGAAGQGVLEPGERSDAGFLAGCREAAQHCCRLAALVAAEECPVVPADRHHASILPISGRKLMFTIDGTRFTVDDCGYSTANSVRAAESSMSRWHPAQ